MKRILTFTALAVMLVFAATATAQTVREVDSTGVTPGSFATLNAAVAAASAGDEIRIVAGGPYDEEVILSAAFGLGIDNLTFTNPAGATWTATGGALGGIALTLGSGVSTCALDGIIITGCAGAGIAMATPAALTVTNSTISTNTNYGVLITDGFGPTGVPPVGAGGDDFLGAAAIIDATNSSFDGNSTSGIWVDADVAGTSGTARISLDACTVSGNTAAAEGAIQFNTANSLTGGESRIELTNGTVIENNTYRGIFFADNALGSNVVVGDSSFIRNNGNHAAICNGTTQTVLFDMTNMSITNNANGLVANKTGPATYTLTNCTVTGNNNAINCSIDGEVSVTISGGTYSGNARAVWLHPVTPAVADYALTISNAAITGQTADGILTQTDVMPVVLNAVNLSSNAAWGINQEGAGTFTATDSTIDGNGAGGIAGGIADFAVVLDNTTVNGNSGDGVFMWNGPVNYSLTMRNGSSVDNNVAQGVTMTGVAGATGDITMDGSSIDGNGQSGVNSGGGQMAFQLSNGSSINANAVHGIAAVGLNVLDIDITDSDVAGNGTSGGGFGIVTGGTSQPTDVADVDISNAEISTVAVGHGMTLDAFLGGGTMDLNDVTMVVNSAGGWGLEYNGPTTITATGCTIGGPWQSILAQSAATPTVVNLTDTTLTQTGTKWECNDVTLNFTRVSIDGPGNDCVKLEGGSSPDGTFRLNAVDSVFSRSSGNGFIFNAANNDLFLNFDGCEINGNQGQMGLWVFQGNLVMDAVDTTINNNVRGLITSFAAATPVTATLTRCELSGNRGGGGDGWTIWPNSTYTNIEFTDCVFDNNLESGMSVFAAPGVIKEHLVFDNCRFTNQDNGAGGGRGLSFEGSAVANRVTTITNCTFDGNVGNGLSYGGGRCSIVDTDFTNNAQGPAVNEALAAAGQWIDIQGGSFAGQPFDIIATAAVPSTLTLNGVDFQGTLGANSILTWLNTNTIAENCTFVANGVSINPRDGITTLTNCTWTGTGRVASFGFCEPNSSPTLVLEDCTILCGAGAVEFSNGSFLIPPGFEGRRSDNIALMKNCTYNVATPADAFVFATTDTFAYVQVMDSDFKSTGGTGLFSNTFASELEGFVTGCTFNNIANAIVAGTGSTMTLSVDQCDFFNPNGPLTAVWMQDGSAGQITVVDSIIDDASLFRFAASSGTVFEDWNVLTGASGLDAGVVSGGNSITAASPDYFETDFASAQYLKLNATSPAANFNSGNGPEPYAGAKGVYVPPNAARYWGLY